MGRDRPGERSFRVAHVPPIRSFADLLEVGGALFQGSASSAARSLLHPSLSSCCPLGAPGRTGSPGRVFGEGMVFGGRCLVFGLWCSVFDTQVLRLQYPTRWSYCDPSRDTPGCPAGASSARLVQLLALRWLRKLSNRFRTLFRVYLLKGFGLPARSSFLFIAWSTGLNYLLRNCCGRKAVTHFNMQAGRGTTRIGFCNRNGQVNEAKTGLPGNDHNQTVYQMRCTFCENRYGANGSDIHLRKCPSCQGGRPGLSLSSVG
jgi:hypothetical protein